MSKIIKSVTNCPICGCECKVEGNTTQYYVPIAKYTLEDIDYMMNKLLNEVLITNRMKNPDSNKIANIINLYLDKSLNK